MTPTLRTEKVRYNYRLRPGAEAERHLTRENGRSRWLWNQCIDTARTTRNSGEPITGKLLSATLTQLRSEIDWLAEGSQNVQEQTVRTYLKARRDAFKVKGRGWPTFESKHRSRPSLNYTRNGFTLKTDSTGKLRLKIAGGVMIPVVWSRQLPTAPTSARVFQDSLGHWYVSFVVEREIEPWEAPTEGTGSSIGIDWGVKTVATTTDPECDIKHAGYAKKAASQLGKYQRRMARRKPKPGQTSSVAYRKAKRDAAKAHRKVASKRLHDQRQAARKIVDRYDNIADENFTPKFMAKSRLARKAADAGIGQQRRLLAEYAARAERNHVLVNPAYSAQSCSVCFVTRSTRQADVI